MHIIKLNAIDSTNSFLKRLIRERDVADNTVVTARYQSGGRGQMQGRWASEPGKNLIFSVFRKIAYLDNDRQFYLSMAVALAVYNALKSMDVPGLAIKWPNDILSVNRKICGILIENSIKNGKTDSAVIGVGVNVNQETFPGLPRAASLKNITGITYDTGLVLRHILETLREYMQMLEEKKFPELHAQYQAQLFRIGKPSTFRGTDNALFTGMIKGVTDEGRLMVLLENETLTTFDLKAVELLY